jgi:RecB family exonuclease
VITPRRTRLVRVSDLHDFRRVVKAWCGGDTARQKPDATYALTKDTDTPKDSAVIVPTRGAATELSRTLPAGQAHPLLLTRDQLYDVLHARLATTARRLTTFDRDAMAQAAAEEAGREVDELPFRIRPGLVAEMLRFYDHLRRQSQHVARFETLITDALGGGAGVDRGAERLLAQTRFLAGAFRAYERRVRESGACDEHGLRHQLIAEPSTRRLRHILVTVPDWIADPAGLFAVDFDLLSRLPGLETLDLVCTESILGSGFHERIHNWWPGLEETDARALVEPRTPVRPQLVDPASADPDRPWFTYRDREEELVAVARRLSEGDLKSPTAWNRTAVVFKRPLPYLYLAPDTLGAAGVAYRAVDALPLAAEPVIATVDLILDAVETSFARESLIALLGSPHLRFSVEGGATFRQSVAEMNRELSERRYLGGLDRLEALAASPKVTKNVAATEALQTGVALARELAVLLEARPASRKIGELLGFLERHFRVLDIDPFVDREKRGRETLTQILSDLARARAAYHDALWTIDDLAAAVRRWIGEETFPVESADVGVHLVDDQAARYGEFEDMTIVGLIENEWPDRPRRNIFFPPGLLKAADARFLDLLGSASGQVALSTFTLDDEALVTRSIQLDEVPRARLSTVTRDTRTAAIPDDDAGEWASMRRSRSPADSSMFHGGTGPRPTQSWSVSALETYTTCPFKFFAQHVLKLEEEPDDEEVMDPRRQGQFVHKVFETFFAEWQAAGQRAITSANLDEARILFVDIVDRSLEPLPEGEAALERTRLLGSSAAAGLGEAVFRMEAERSVPVVERLLEHELKGRFTIATESGPRDVELRGKADRVDLLADGTFRLIDYKLGWPPDRNRALQLPVYGICAEQRLDGRHGRKWTLGEAVYLAFKGPKRVVPLFTSPSARDEVLAKAQQRLADTIDAIDRGQFPPAPDDVYRCETCSFASVCRKDYVGDV